MRTLLSLVILLLFLQPAEAQLAPTGTLRVAFLGSNPVQGRVDASTGAVSGPVSELTTELARRLGVPFRIVPVPDAAALIDAVRTGRVDVGLLAVEAARATQVDFSAPYALMGNAYLVRADSAIARSADVDRDGVVVGAVRGQSQQVWVSEQLRRARVHMVPQVPPAADIVGMLMSGEIHAFAANRQRMEDVARGSGDVRVLPDNFSVIPQALVVARGEATRLAQLNEFVADAIRSGLVARALERARLAGVEVAGLAEAGRR
jgi:polar amino acid transport system substrate-binding protein